MLGYRILSLWCQAAWSYLLHAALLHPPYLMSNCLMSCTSVHQVMLFDLFFMMLGCLVFSISCYAAGPSHLMSGCLMSPKSCYVFCFCFTLLHCLILFSSYLLMLCCFTTRPTSCYLVFSTSDLWFLIVWSCLGDATLLDLDYLMLRCLMSPTSGCAAYPCVMLSCLIFSESCYATRSGLHNATLLDCLYLMLRCWTFPTACYVSWCFLYHVMLFDLVIKTVRCLIFYTSCYVLDLPLLCCLYSLYIYIYIVEFFVWFSCCYAAWPSLPLVRPYVMLLNVLCIILCYSVLPSRCYAAWFLRQTTLLDLP